MRTVLSIGLALVVGLSILLIHPEYVKAQQLNNPKDRDQLMKTFKEGKDAIQNDLDTNLGQLLNVIKVQLNFNSVDSHLSLASQYFAEGNQTDGLSELEKANHEWQNTSMTIVNTGNEISSIAKNNTSALANSTSVILNHLGKIFVGMGVKAEDLRLKLAS
jgi:hypothetical protein